MKIVPVHGYAALHFVDESALLLSDLHYGVEAEMLRGAEFGFPIDQHLELKKFLN